MRIGFVGPASGDTDTLARAIELLLADPAVEQVIYLGDDGAADAVMASWSERSMGPEEFLDRAAHLAAHGSPERILQLLDEERAAARLAAVRRLPAHPARAIEMMDKWIVLAVHDKAVLDEEDIANAQIIVYGRSEAPDLKQFGPRAFFTPGPLANGTVGRLDVDGSAMHIRVLSLDGDVRDTKTLQTTTAKLVVSS